MPSPQPGLTGTHRDGRTGRWRRQVLAWGLRLLSVAILVQVVRFVPLYDRVALPDGHIATGTVHDTGDGTAVLKSREGGQFVLPADWRTAGDDVRYQPGLIPLLGTLDGTPLVVGLLLAMAAIVVSGVRWRFLARGVGIPLTLPAATRLMCIAQLYQYAPGGLATADVVKAVYLRQRTGRTGEALVSSFVDRLVGLLTMVTVGLAGLLVGVLRRELVLAEGVDLSLAVGLMGALVAGFVLAAGLLFSGWWEPLLVRLPGIRRLRSLAEPLVRYRHAHGALLLAAGASVVSQGVQIALIALFGEALGLGVPLWQYVVVWPLASVFGAIPGLPGGLGLVEGGYVGGFLLLGLPMEQAGIPVALALLWRLNFGVLALAGGYFALTMAKPSDSTLAPGAPPAPAQKEQNDAVLRPDTSSV